jgi:hypothetical protein
MMASQKKTIDVIGSIDDYALEPSIDAPPTRVDDNTWSSPRIIFGVNEKVLAGDNFTPIPADPSFVVGENRWGDKMVWPLKPYCVSCSPAAKKIDDDKQTATFDEMGAEMVTSIRESRLKNLSPSNYYSFTLVEIGGKLHCKKCEGGVNDSNTQNAESELFGHEKKIVYEPATFDVERPMLGVRVDEGVFRYPQKLVSYWVESDGFEHQTIYVLRKEKIYSIMGKEFIKKAIFEEKNKQWLLNPQYCDEKETLQGFIENNLLKVRIESVLEWRKSAVPLSVMIVAENDGKMWSISQEDFLKRGYKQNQSWAIPIQSCGKPLMGLKDIDNTP